MAASESDQAAAVSPAAGPGAESQSLGVTLALPAEPWPGGGPCLGWGQGQGADPPTQGPGTVTGPAPIQKVDIEC